IGLVLFGLAAKRLSVSSRTHEPFLGTRRPNPHKPEAPAKEVIASLALRACVPGFGRTVLGVVPRSPPRQTTAATPKAPRVPATWDFIVQILAGRSTKFRPRLLVAPHQLFLPPGVGGRCPADSRLAPAIGRGVICSLMLWRDLYVIAVPLSWPHA